MKKGVALLRTKGAWLYTCKDCFGMHLIPYDELNEDVNEKVRVHIKCPKSESYIGAKVYQRTDFTRWVGDEVVYDFNIVKPVNVVKYE